MGAVALLEAVDRAQRQQAPKGGTPQLAQLNAADPSRGFSTPYYAAYTNSGDLAAAFNAADGQKVRLVDPKTGQVYAEGVGSQGAQQIATLATQLGNDLGRKAQWQIQTQNPDDTYTTVGYDRYDPKNNLLKSIVRIAAPILGAAIPGLGPVLGAALGGFGGTVATGGSLTQALLAAASSGLGNSLGGALSGALRGAPVSFSGVNPLAGVGSALRSGSLTDALLGGIGGDAITGATTLAPLTVTAGAAPGLTSSLLSGAGSALGGLGGSIVTGGSGTDRFTGDNIGNDQIVSGQQPGAEPTSETTLDTVTIEGTRPNDLGWIENVAESGLGSYNNSAWARQNAGLKPVDQPPSLKDFALDTTGQAIGGIGADMVSARLAEMLGLLPKPNLDGVADAGYDDAPAVGPKTGTVFDPYMGGDGDVPVPDSLGPKPAPLANDAGGGAGAAAAAAGAGGGGGALFNAQNPGAAAPAPSTAGSDIDTEGSFAPDIYPWRKAMMAQ